MCTLDDTQEPHTKVLAQIAVLASMPELGLAYPLVLLSMALQLQSCECARGEANQAQQGWNCFQASTWEAFLTFASHISREIVE